MEMRKLTRDELKAMDIVKGTREKKLKLLNDKLKVINFNLDYEINYNFEVEILRWKKMLRETKEDINKHTTIIDTMNDQINNGVPKK